MHRPQQILLYQCDKTWMAIAGHITCLKLTAENPGNLRECQSSITRAAWGLTSPEFDTLHRLSDHLRCNYVSGPQCCSTHSFHGDQVAIAQADGDTGVTNLLKDEPVTGRPAPKWDLKQMILLMLCP
ncbi:hypothetical protein PBRA_007630 [Plasmodiophora brassicae]|uniref:Uncharacterized protein n=1 Tax=Plasmodiophora brassicae TaxID=37360 RepID=A0A0G4IXV1_PLABS|nr:hypothetical protein PBRA_007630 [Plasmodiophora brassicae]